MQTAERLGVQILLVPQYQKVVEAHGCAVCSSLGWVGPLGLTVRWSSEVAVQTAERLGVRIPLIPHYQKGVEVCGYAARSSLGWVSHSQGLWSE